jgi:hypothetical protein
MVLLGEQGSYRLAKVHRSRLYSCLHGVSIRRKEPPRLALERSPMPVAFIEPILLLPATTLTEDANSRCARLKGSGSDRDPSSVTPKGSL